MSPIQRWIANNIPQRLSHRFLTQLTTETVVTSTSSDVKSFDQVPSAGGYLTSALNLILDGGPAYLHEHCDKQHNRLGPIFREHLGPIELVFLSDTRMMKTVIANEGPFPHHNVPPAWLFYNKLKKVERGLFFQSGHAWERLRKVFNKVMMTESKINRFNDGILQINEDLFKTWTATADTSDEIFLHDLKDQLCKWSIETTCFMLFGRRLGCVPDGTIKDERAGELVKQVSRMFSETSRLQIIPVELAHKFNLDTWKRFERATDEMLKIANTYVQENLRNLESRSLLTDVLELGGLTDEEVSRSIVDLIIAAADTTSNSLQWMLYIIAKHPDIQSKLRKESTQMLGENGDNPNPRTISYLKAFSQEVSRLYPVAPFLARTLDKDVVLGGYSIPPRQPIVLSMYTTSRMNKYFDEAAIFKPERWLREGKSRVSCDQAHQAYASLPFGVGGRMCIGRRAAQLEMFLFVASFVDKFQSSLVRDDIGVKLNMILCPDKPIELRLKARVENAVI